MCKAYSTQLAEYIERMLEIHKGFSGQMSPKKFTEYSKIRAEVTKHVGISRPLTQEQFEMAIKFVDNYMLISNNELREFSSKMHNKYGGLENFFNCTANRYDDPYIDEEMQHLVKRLNQLGAYTVGSCYGHKENSICYIDFATFVKPYAIKQALDRLKININKYKIETITHKFSRFTYQKLTILDKGILTI